MEPAEVFLTFKPIVLVVGVAMFVGLVGYVFWPRRKRELEAHGEIPLRED